MKASVIVWGIVMLIIFSGAHWLFVNNVVAESWLWVAIAIIFVVATYLVGRTMKKMPKGTETLWPALSVFGFLTTIAVAAGIVPVPFAWLMALWLLLFGAAIGVGGYMANNALDMFMGVVLVFSALFISAFGQSYFLAGALLLGFLAVVHGYFTGE